MPGLRLLNGMIASEEEVGVVGGRSSRSRNRCILCMHWTCVKRLCVCVNVRPMGPCYDHFFPTKCLWSFGSAT